MEKKSLLVAKAPVEIRRAHMKPTTFLKKYGRILIGGTIILAVLFCSIFAPLLTSWDPEAISIRDIAHALSLICRGNGHVRNFWSVGQHCLDCAHEAQARKLSPRMILACLLHDASE